jgi:hypothetical protein
MRSRSLMIFFIVGILFSSCAQQAPGLPDARGTRDNAGSSCTAPGAPDCGGNCSITCPVGKSAVCIGGSCRPGLPTCVCESYTSCRCQ